MTLKELYDNDFSGIKLEINEKVKQIDPITKQEIATKEIIKNCWSSIKTGARQLCYFVNEDDDYLNLIKFIVQNYKLDEEKFSGTQIESGFSSDIKFGTIHGKYTANLYVYCQNTISDNDRIVLNEFKKNIDCTFIIRDNKYLLEKMNNSKPQAFISHDSNDKELIARPIAKGLSSRLCTVWYDEYSLKVGDSLRESIEKGIKEAKKCILVLTPNFLSNNGWTKKEFDSIFTREILFEERLILPVWYNISPKEIYEYSPALADTVALQWPCQNNYKNESEHKRAIEIIISNLHAQITK